MLINGTFQGAINWLHLKTNVKIDETFFQPAAPFLNKLDYLLHTGSKYKVHIHNGYGTDEQKGI